MKRYNPNGKYIKELRERRESRATQKELAHEARISERHLRQVENKNAAISLDVLQRIAKALGAPWEALVFASDQPRLVPGADTDKSHLQSAPQEKKKPTIMPRFDTGVADVVRDEEDLFKGARGSHVLISHVFTNLTAETQSYAEEILDLLEPLTGRKGSPHATIRGREELQIRGRLRDLLVLLKGNDVWVYMTDHFRNLPESDVVPEKRDTVDFEFQLILAFGPPGEYGEESLKVPIDHGQPWVYPEGRLF